MVSTLIVFRIERRFDTAEIRSSGNDWSWLGNLDDRVDGVHGLIDDFSVDFYSSFTLYSDILL